MGYETNLEYKFFKRKNIAIIGCGVRARDLLIPLREMSMNTKITALLDPNSEAVIANLRADGEDVSEIKVWDDVDKMLDESGVDGVIVGTQSETHVYYAKKVLERNIPLFLEKPITFSMDELIDLRNTYDKSEKKVVVSFPLHTSPMLNLVKEILDSGLIGTPEHMQAFNYVPYGGVYFHNWYSKTGPAGLFFEKTTHDFDWINRLLGIKPTELAVMTSQRIFGGDMPSGKSCTDCEHQLTCKESPFLQKNYIFDNPQGSECAFTKDVKTYDSAGILIRYESGMHVNYAENHFARKGAGARGARISGYSGTLDFDWYTNTVNVHRHHSPIVQKYEIDASLGHFGGDRGLLFDFVRMMNGENDTTANLDAGFISTLMCLAAKKSLEEKCFAPVVWGDGRKI